MQRQRGFTLIEVLVVLVIVAIITAVAVMAFGDFGRGRSEKIGVETFTRIIGVAQSQAILTPQVLGLSITPKGFLFYTWTPKNTQGKWKPIKDSILSQPNAFAGLFDAQVKTVSRYDPTDQNTQTTPIIVFLPSGYVTPFELMLKGKEHHFDVTVSSNAAFKITDVGAKTK